MKTPWRIGELFAASWLLHAVASCAAAAGPYEYVHAPFAFHATFSLDEHAAELNEVVDLQAELQEQLGIGPAQEHIDVYLFSDEKSYRAYMARFFENLTPRRAMFIKSNGPGNVFAYRSKELAVDLRHECTHALLHAAIPMVPLWLDEGLAEYFEVPDSERPEQNPYLSKVRRATYWKKCPSLERLEVFTKLSQMGYSEYRDAWSWVHFMLHGPSRARNALTEYIAQLSESRVPTPLSQRLTEQLDVEREFKNHFRRRNFLTAARQSADSNASKGAADNR